MPGEFRVANRDIWLCKHEGRAVYDLVVGTGPSSTTEPFFATSLTKAVRALRGRGLLPNKAAS